MKKVEELELKVLAVNKEHLINELEKNNAEKILDALTEIWTFDISKSFEIEYTKLPAKLVDTVKIAEELTWHGKSLRDQNYHLRARKQGEHYEFTLKFSKPHNMNVKKEIELNINLTKNEWGKIGQTITDAGLIVTAHQQKKRISYQIDHDTHSAHFDIDTWPGIPTYLEIEASSSEIINYWIKKLLLGENQVTILSGQSFFDLYNINFYSELLFK
ncbi:hypothetical protein KC675_03830 [Candidatus Dojkabacteria bacterium]|jgi:hypothetical protein|uniref:CYTH domain-containing protein n=1 Tax=Candidatus Dojkabacteria bacterium TaxID=2099670 RepID=A0A955I935_9BACT|nr:hypothetical protein [Candidatus Dojkabacteria bacterium]